MAEPEKSKLMHELICKEMLKIVELAFGKIEGVVSANSAKNICLDVVRRLCCILEEVEMKPEHIKETIKSLGRTQGFIRLLEGATFEISTDDSDRLDRILESCISRLHIKLNPPEQPGPSFVGSCERKPDPGALR
ncbi:MAG: hypothetical protein WC663_02630 [Patescibacteria group bacterium]